MFLISFFENILEFSYNITNNYGLSIIFLSIIISIITIPLFSIVEFLQKKRKLHKAKMQHDLNKLESVSNKKEKYYYTRRVYKQYSYNPIFSIFDSFSLLIQIPFFLAAYWLLIDYNPFIGTPFGLIQDLAIPDQLIPIGGISFNLLPLFMTLINMLSSYYYLKKTNSDKKIQFYSMALFFLFILYDMPSSLVIYWTVNNCVSLIKNYIDSYKIDTISILKTKSKKSILLSDYFLYMKNNFIVILIIFTSYFLIQYLISNILISRGADNNNEYLIKILIAFIFDSLIIYSVVIHYKKIFNNNFFKSISIFLLFIIIFLHLNLVEVNMFFLRMIKLGKFELLILGQIIYLISFFVFNRGSFLYRGGNINFNLNDLILFLLPTSILVMYFSNNMIYFNKFSFLLYFLILLIIPLIICCILIFFIKKITNYTILISSYVSSLIVLYMMPLINLFFKIDNTNNIALQVVCLIFFICIISYVFYKRRILLLFFSFSIFIGSIINVFIMLNSKYDNSINKNEINILSIKNHNDPQKVLEQYSNKEFVQFLNDNNYLSKKEEIKKPNIYCLGYDAYVNPYTMNNYGIDNSEHFNWLKDKGFIIYDNIYSAAPSTELAMPLILSMANNNNQSHKDVNLGYNTVNELLKIQGYDTYYINGPGSLIGKTGFNGDFSIPEERVNIKKTRFKEMLYIVYGILRGKFDEHLKKWDNINSRLRRLKKLELLKEKHDNPKFIFNHINLPYHAFENDYNNNHIFDYSIRLNKANTFMKEDVEAALNDDNSIIILFGDHGANLYFDVGYRLYGNINEDLIERRHLIDMYGAFLAVKIPDNFNSTYYDSLNIVQDIFYSVFASIYENKDFYKYKLNKTLPLKNSSIDKIPIKNGIIQIGKNKGNPLFINN